MASGEIRIGVGFKMKKTIDFSNSDDTNIVQKVLVDSILDEFSFHTNFTLFFSRNPNKAVIEMQIPCRFSLSILGEWWFGEKNEWNNMVEKLTKNYDFVEPDEPVLAFRLAALRWNSNAIITDVQLTRTYIRIVFDDNEIITISNYSIEDSSWEIWDVTNNYIEDDEHWYVICEEGEVYYNVPIN